MVLKSFTLRFRSTLLPLYYPAYRHGVCAHGFSSEYWNLASVSFANRHRASGCRCIAACTDVTWLRGMRCLPLRFFLPVVARLVREYVQSLLWRCILKRIYHIYPKKSICPPLLPIHRTSLMLCVQCSLRMCGPKCSHLAVLCLLNTFSLYVQTIQNTASLVLGLVGCTNMSCWS